MLALLLPAGYSADMDTLPWNIPLDLGSAIQKPSFLSPWRLRWRRQNGLRSSGFLCPCCKKGIAIWLSSRRAAPVILGAGHGARVGAAMSDNWGSFDAWQVYGKRSIRRGAGEGRPPKLIGETILIERTEAASGLLYWTGRAFRWYQQSD